MSLPGVFPILSESGSISNLQNERNTMLEGLMQPVHLLIVFGVALLVFGPKKLPELGRGLGEGIRGFRGAIAEGKEKDKSESDRTKA